MIGQVTRETIKQLNWAQEKRETAQLKPKIFLNSSEAKTVVLQFIQAHAIHLMLMSAYNRSPLRTFF